MEMELKTMETIEMILADWRFYIALSATMMVLSRNFMVENLRNAVKAGHSALFSGVVVGLQSALPIPLMVLIAANVGIPAGGADSVAAAAMTILPAIAIQLACSQLLKGKRTSNRTNIFGYAALVRS